MVSRLLIIGLIIFIGAVAGLQHPRSAVAFPYKTSRWVWGENAKGELGNFSDQNPDRPIISSALPAGILLTRLSAGSNSPLLGSHSLAVDRNRNVWAWGYNIYGQVGDGGSGSTAVFGPVKVCAAGQTAPCSQFLSDITAVAAGGLHSLALDIHSNVWAWGYNAFGQLGSNVPNTALPVRNNALFAQLHQLPGPPSVKAIAAGAHHSLALDSRGVVWAWGYNWFGQLGLGHYKGIVFALPIAFPEGEVIIAIAAGAYHSLALDSAGNVWAWGTNANGQLGISSFDERRNVPVKLVYFPPNTRIIAIAAGGLHSLALDSGGNVWAWGANGAGQLGNAQNIEQHAPTRTIFPGGIPRLVRIAAGGVHNLAIDANHNVWSWGGNGSGQLGNQQRFVNSNVPVPAGFPEGTRIVTIAAGGFHSLALESRSFFYGVEAVLDFKALTAQALLLPQSLEQDEPIDLETTSTNLDPAGNKTLVTHTLTDTAGNTLVLTLTQQRINGNGLALQVMSVQYNDGEVMIPPRNRNELVWKTDASGNVTVLQQHVFLDGADGVTNITTHYIAAKDQTAVYVESPTGPEHFTEPGMVTVQMSTINGNLSFSDGTHIWP